MGLALLRAIAGKLADSDQPILAAASGYGSGSDPDAGLPGNQYYRQIGGSRLRDLPNVTRRALVERAFAFLDGHPLATRYASLCNEWTKPQRFKPKALNPVIDEIVQEVWEDARNDWKTRLPQFNDVVAATGTLGLPAMVNAKSGIPIFDYMDPAEIVDVKFAAGTNCVPEMLIYQPATTGDQRTLQIPIVRPERDEGNVGMFGRLVARDPKSIKPDGDKLGGLAGVLYFRWNCRPNSAFGRGDFMASLDYWATLDDFHAAVAERAQYLARVSGSMEVDGNDADVAKAAAEMSVSPGFSAVLVHNKKRKPTFQAPNTNAADTSEAERMMRVYSGAPLGIPPQILSGDMTQGNRAIALTAMEPMFMRGEAIQARLALVVWMAMTYAVDSVYWVNPSRFSSLPKEGKEAKEAWKIEVELPALLRKDLTDAGPALSALTASLALAVERGIIDRGTARRIMIRAANELGMADLSLQEVEDRLTLEIPTSAPPATGQPSEEDGAEAVPSAIPGEDGAVNKDQAAAEGESLQQRRLLMSGIAEIVKLVADRVIPRESGIETLVQIAKIERSSAEALMGPAGTDGFESKADAQADASAKPKAEAA